MSLVTASVAEQTVQLIRDAIMTGTLRPGERYSVDQVAEVLRLGVSRTPVREALVRLSESGMVRVEPNRGYRIIKTDVRRVEELFRLRLVLEVPAAYDAARRANKAVTKKLQAELDAMDQIASRAAKGRQALATTSAADGESEDTSLQELDLKFVKRDTTFHELVLSTAGNRELVDIVRNLRHGIAAQGAWRLSKSRTGGLSEVSSEHALVLKAVENHDPVAAARAMYKHLTKTGNLMMDQLEKEDCGTYDRRWSQWFNDALMCLDSEARMPHHRLGG